MSENFSYQTRNDDENSLGILSLDNLKAFGENSSVCSKDVKKRSVSNNLTIERAKAVDVLKRANISGKYRTEDWVNRHQLAFDQDDDISALITDKTIDLNTYSSIDSVADSKVSFQPGEITGRSTLNRTSKDSKNISVRDILATSHSEKVRKLVNELEPEPQKCEPFRLTCGNSTSYMDDISDGEFMPGELINSQLVEDEIAWAQQYAAIPTKVIGNEAKKKLETCSCEISEIDERIRNSALLNDADFSVGMFFKARSENLLNIVGTNNTEENITNNLEEFPSSLPLAENKACSNNAKGELQDKISVSQHDSYLLSMSAIAKALQNMAIDTDTSTDKFEHFFNIPKLAVTSPKSKKSESLMEPYIEEDDKENTDPTLTDDSKKSYRTLSVAGSFLSCAGIREHRRSISAARSPLSPLLDLTLRPVVNTEQNEENDADIDEFPSTPIVTSNRRVRRTKSPNDEVYTDKKITDSTMMDGSPYPINKLLAGVTGANLKSLSSTRIDGCEAIERTISSLDLATSSHLNETQSSSNDQGSNKSLRSRSTSPVRISLASGERELFNDNMRKTTASPALSEVPSNFSNGNTGAIRKTNSASNMIRSVSRFSNCSEFSHRDGKSIPLKVTQLQLSWGSTRLRKDTRRSLKVKNTGDKRLAVRMGICGPGFQLINSTSNILTLQSQECRSIDINFCPTVTGAAVGMLSFYAPYGVNNLNISFLDIPLYGYGGSAGVIIHGLHQGPVGDCYLPMGEVSQLISGLIEAEFEINNKGPLVAFACITIESAAMMKPRISDAFEVYPKQVIIPPQKKVTIRITFCPHREDIKKIIKRGSQVTTLASMRIICGDEATRQRMRCLVQRISVDERSKLTANMLDSLWERIPDEQKIDLSSIKEEPEYLSELSSSLRMYNVALTLNRDFDETSEASSIYFPDADDTVVFRTICCGSSRSPSPGSVQNQNHQLDTVDEILEEVSGALSNQVGFSVNPATVLLKECEKGCMLILKSSFKTEKHFEVTSNSPEFLHLIPSSGYVRPHGGQVEIKVSPLKHYFQKHSINDLNNIYIRVSIEDEYITIPVKVTS